jgi:hypothetical protein
MVRAIVFAGTVFLIMRIYLKKLPAFIFFLFLCSCTTAPADTFVPFWIPLEKGLDYWSGRTETPRLQFWAVRVDLSEPSLKIVVNGQENTGGNINHMPSTTVSGFVQRFDCLVGINANPFDPVSGREGEDRRVAGLMVAEGVVYAEPAPRYDALVFYHDGRAAIVSQAALGDLSTVRNAVGGFYAVLKDGLITEKALEERGQARHPRSAAGLADGFLYLLVIDGRRLGSIGATEAETGLILRQLGARDALAFDGGGSTALALRTSDGGVSLLNTPVAGLERGVATCLGIRRRAPETGGSGRPWPPSGGKGAAPPYGKAARRFAQRGQKPLR